MFGASRNLVEIALQFSHDAYKIPTLQRGLRLCWIHLYLIPTKYINFPAPMHTLFRYRGEQLPLRPTLIVQLSVDYVNGLVEDRCGTEVTCCR